ncbi:FkbM family methyltransferase [Wenzhouxiangella limi]|uniref:FkbM family methyltransferase n=1 Tax=Wenzhouxiangella limi TaxID=2707351 RepID=A0A845UZT3_9GAMM|nr:FkbM family methyltransferase [Wenzhouxiangella limi]NDY96288.1 FkbM family methyltransferase [Wenzhouxiangella limi]
MDWLQQQLQNTPPPDAIIHLGAGLCRELPTWQQTGAKRIVLVEPNPELLAELRRSTADHDNVEIIAAAIADQPGRGSFPLFNFPLLSSLREPTGLYHSLPGLQQTGRATVEQLTVDQLLDRLGIDIQTGNWLVIDTPGEEAAVIDQLQRSDRLHHFARIFLSAGIEPLYEGAKSAADLVIQLQAQGFEPASQPDTTDADWPRHHLRLDRMALECKRLKAELARYQTLEAEHKADLQAIEKALASVQQVLAESDRQHQNELNALKTQLAESEQARTQAEEQQKAQLAKTQQLESALTEQKSTSEKLGTELHQHKKDLARLTQAHDEAQQKLTEAEQKLANLTEQEKRLKALEEENASLRTQLEAKAKEASEATRKQQEELKQLQAKLSAAENDAKSTRQHNDDLQQKYRKLEQEYQRKEALIDEEFLKAESQLELIKELVFRDKPV